MRVPRPIARAINQPQLALIGRGLVARLERQQTTSIRVVVVGHAVSGFRVDDLDVVRADGVGAGGFLRVAAGRVVRARVQV